MNTERSYLPTELKSCAAKLLRAQERLNDLAAEMQEWRGPERPYRLVRENQPQVGNHIDYIYKVEVLRRPPLEWSVTIGEVLYNIHSALDHLASRLAEREGHTRRVTFPIFKNRAKFWREKDGSYTSQSGAARLMLMPESARPLIEAVQPYQRGNESPLHPLWLLHELSNADKHHTLHIVGAALVETKFTVGPGHDTIAELRSANYGPFDDGDEIGRVRLWITGPNPDATLKPQFATNETFAETGPAPGQRPGAVLQDIIDYVLDEVLIERFDPYFTS